MFKDQAIVFELNRLISELTITSSQITFRDKKYTVSLQDHLKSIINILYSECYALKENYQTGLYKKKAITFESDSKFVQQLSRHNFTSEKIDDGWHIKKNLSNSYFEINKGSTKRIVHLSQFRNSHITDTTVSIFLPKEDTQRQPTFYYAFSNKAIDLNKKITRIYWNINSEGAALLIEAITKKLNTYAIPFLFKCLNHPNLYFRRDAAVLYIENENLQLAKLVLPELITSVTNYLEDDVPLFTFKYNKGVGIAESPENNESFGMHRVGLLAKSLLNLSLTTVDTNTKLKHIENHFSEEGISPEAPFLNKGSKTLF